jgi:hypothetical protein
MIHLLNTVITKLTRKIWRSNLRLLELLRLPVVFVLVKTTVDRESANNNLQQATGCSSQMHFHSDT